MMHYRFFGCLTLMVLFLFACEVRSDKETLPSSSGKYGEVLVVVDTTYENGQIGEILNELFNKAMPGLPQLEPQFRMATVAPKNFKSILKRSRNILMVSIKKESKTRISLERNIWAKEQLLINISASSEQKAQSILEKNIQTIRDYFNEEELERLSKQYSKKQEEKLIAEIEKKHKIKLKIPPAFIEMSKAEDGVWLKKEKNIGEHQIMQGLAIYSYPYKLDSTFSIGEMGKNRDEFTAKHIQGTRDSSHMRIYDEYSPQVRELNVNGYYVKEYRGLWNMKNDFMGGPFIHYTLVDEERNRVINLDGFVYAPKFDKREYLRELEAIMRSIKITPS